MFKEHLKVKPPWRAGSPHAFLSSISLLGLPQPSSTTQQVGSQLPCRAICMLPQSWTEIFAQFSGRGFSFWVAIACSGPNPVCPFHFLPIEWTHWEGKGFDGTNLGGKISATPLPVVQTGWDSVNGKVQGPLGLHIKSLYCKSWAASPQCPTTHKLRQKRELSPHAPKKTGF